jgi:ATP-binding cassette, subfamily B, bacterial
VNGAGKTTLVKLLVRLYDPDEGQILWDGIDLRDFAPDELRERIGAIFQDFAKYDFTARENIGLGRVTYIDDMERIQRVAEEARVAEMIAKMPEGYETVLSRWLVEEDKKGDDLSGGQWQKMALARMYMREAEADFLILDEPTAALDAEADAEAEYEIYSQFAKLVKNRTALLISHRFSTVRMADLVAVLDGGKITEYGTHEELIALGGTYARLYGLQAGQYA